MEILAARMLVRPVNPARTLSFYRDVLQLAVYREFPGGTVFFLGGGYLEVSGQATAAEAKSAAASQRPPAGEERTAPRRPTPSRTSGSGCGFRCATWPPRTTPVVGGTAVARSTGGDQRDAGAERRLHRQPRDRPEPVGWGVGLVRGGTCTALVGSHAEVADRITEYHTLASRSSSSPATPIWRRRGGSVRAFYRSCAAGACGRGPTSPTNGPRARPPTRPCTDPDVAPVGGQELSPSTPASPAEVIGDSALAADGVKDEQPLRKLRYSSRSGFASGPTPLQR